MSARSSNRQRRILRGTAQHPARMGAPSLGIVTIDQSSGAAFSADSLYTHLLSAPGTVLASSTGRLVFVCEEGDLAQLRFIVRHGSDATGKKAYAKVWQLHELDDPSSPNLNAEFVGELVLALTLTGGAGAVNTQSVYKPADGNNYRWVDTVVATTDKTRGGVNILQQSGVVARVSWDKEGASLVVVELRVDATTDTTAAATGVGVLFKEI